MNLKKEEWTTLDEEMKNRIFQILMQVRIPIPFLFEGNNIIEIAPFSERAAQRLTEKIYDEISGFG